MRSVSATIACHLCDWAFQTIGKVIYPVWFTFEFSLYFKTLTQFFRYLWHFRAWYRIEWIRHITRQTAMHRKIRKNGDKIWKSKGSSWALGFSFYWEVKHIPFVSHGVIESDMTEQLGTAQHSTLYASIIAWTGAAQVPWALMLILDMSLLPPCVLKSLQARVECYSVEGAQWQPHVHLR